MLELLKEPDFGGKTGAGSSNPEIKPEPRGNKTKDKETGKGREHQRESSRRTKLRMEESRVSERTVAPSAVSEVHPM